MQKQVICLLLPIFISLPGVLSAAEKTYTLQQCLEMALTRNPSVLASVERKTEAQWKKKSAYDDFLPKLNMDYAFEYMDEAHDIDADFIGIDDVSVTEHNNYMMSLHIDQPLFTGFRLTETYNLADLGLKEAVAGEQLAHLEITYQTVRAYFNYLMIQKFQNVADDAVIQLISHLNDSEQFYKNDMIPLNDLLQSKVHLANARQDARIAASRTRMARIALATIIKEPLSLIFNVEDAPDMTRMTSKVETLTVQALDTRPELLRANYNLEASKKYITLAKSTYYPTITLSAAHNRYGGDAAVNGHGLSDLRDSEETMIGVYASWELFAWGQTNHKVSQASAASREANQTLTAVMDEIKLEVRDNFISALTSYENIATAKTAVEQAGENLRMNELRYKNQLSTNTNVLDARTLLTQTETKYYKAIYNYNTQLAGLARAVGVSSWKDLQVN
ncbi:MAG: TolC family protein [Proteobacteria bacterium]|nr:TolC family protein [Pseudomonadota bacterium]